jgi:hypothetical protein
MTDEDKSYALKQMHDRNTYLNKQLKLKDQEIEKLKKQRLKAKEFVLTEYNSYPSAEEWRKALLDILK